VWTAGEKAEDVRPEAAQGPDGGREIDVVSGVGGGAKGCAELLPLADDEGVKDGGRLRWLRHARYVSGDWGV
jgi:hypothetical protein